MIASSFTWPSGKAVQFRIGLHSGPVVAGVLGNERLQYDVWGDTVNVASRMESSSEPGRIHVSKSFANALAPLELERGGAKGAGVRYRGEVEIKGKGTMKTFWLE
jgi:class 3 adenylate cyclase